MKTIASLVAAATLAASVLPAHAFVTGRTNFAPQTFGNVPVNVFQAAGIVVTPFNLPTARTVAITYSAECQVSGIAGFVSLEIIVDGVVRAPTVGLDDRFCASDQTAALDNAAFRSITVPVALGAGLHNLRIRAVTFGGGVIATLDDSSTVVHD